MSKRHASKTKPQETPVSLNLRFLRVFAEQDFSGRCQIIPAVSGVFQSDRINQQAVLSAFQVGLQIAFSRDGFCGREVFVQELLD